MIISCRGQPSTHLIVSPNFQIIFLRFIVTVRWMRNWLTLTQETKNRLRHTSMLIYDDPGQFSNEEGYKNVPYAYNSGMTHR